MMGIRFPKILLVFLIITGIFYQCTNRDRSNPFDPGSNNSAAIDLFINPIDNYAQLSWQVNDVTDFQGFRLYRSVDSDSFGLFKELSPDMTSFVDSTLSYYHWYQYRISILGFTQETPPSNTVKMLAGPGTVWILSRYGSSIREISYDLQHVNRIIYTNSPSINWDWSSGESEIWMAHAQYRYISRMNLALGNEDFFLQNDFQRPIDIKWDSNRNLVCVLDPTAQKVYIVNDQSVVDTFAVQSDHVFKILLSPQSEIIAIDSHSVCIYSDLGDLLTNLTLQTSFVGQDMTLNGNNLYILSADPLLNKSAITTYDIVNTTGSRNEVTGIFNIICKLPDKNYFWMAENINDESSRAVKLSHDGIRLLELSSLSDLIDDIKINPHDESIVIVQSNINIYEELNYIVLYDKTGQQLSSTNQIFNPVKVYIQ
jgi:hypothetical protein